MHTWIQMYMFNHEKIIWWHLRRFKWPKMFYIRQNYYWNIKFHVSAHSWGPTYCKVCHISPVLFNRLLPHCYCCSRRARPLKDFIHSYPYVIRMHEVSVFFYFFIYSASQNWFSTPDPDFFLDKGQGSNDCWPPHHR